MDQPSDRSVFVAAAQFTFATLVCFAIPISFFIPATAEAKDLNDQTDLTQLPIEALMNIQVTTASKFPQKTIDAPASVTVITAADIKNYGYRTLADILRSVRGFYTSYDRNYDYLGVRGFGRTGDYNSRMLLLVDGYRINDPIYDTAPIGTEFPVDVDLIDRVEVVRGPGSSIYGSNANFGVINVITKQGKDFNGMAVSAEAASFGTDKERVTYGKRNENGADVLLSISRYYSRGQDLFFPEFDTPENNNGIAHHLDWDRYENFLGKFSYNGLTLTGGFSNRIKGVPTAAFDSVFNDPNFQTTDGLGFLDLGYVSSLDKRWDIYSHVSYGRYFYDGLYPAGSPVVINKDVTRAQWWGAEIKFIGRFDKHKVVAGVEYQNNFQQDQSNFDIDPYALYLDDKRTSNRKGLYAQDEITLSRDVLLNAGLRYDHYSSAGGTFNPRVALIWKNVGKSTLKFLYGTAFRAPNFYELYYSSEGSQKANPQLKPEKITTYEFILEHALQRNFTLTADAYYNKIGNHIDQITDPSDGLLVFENTGRVNAKGLEFEVERLWDSGAQLRSSYAWQITRQKNTGTEPVNSPRHLAKLNISAPLWNTQLRTGLELQFTGRRKTLAGGAAGGYLVTNLTLLGEKLAKGLELSASIYNLFDKHYADPGAPEHVQDVIMQDGRSFRIKATYHF